MIPILEEVDKESIRAFDGMDYNNQRNVLVFALGESQGGDIGCKNCPNYDELCNGSCHPLQNLDADTLIEVLSTLTRKGGKMRFDELFNLK